MTMSEVQRLGDVTKCPACGSEVDPGAYHCPRCRNYFCFHCRARVPGSETQFQCVNLECDYHGKLVCEQCDPEVTKDEPPAVYVEREGGWWPQLMMGSFAIFVVALFYAEFWVAIAIAVGAFAGGAFLLRRVGVNVFGRDNQIVGVPSLPSL